MQKKYGPNLILNMIFIFNTNQFFLFSETLIKKFDNGFDFQRNSQIFFKNYIKLFFFRRKVTFRKFSKINIR